MTMRCEDFPCCGHTDGDSCEPYAEGTSEHWHEVYAQREADGYDFDDPMFDQD